MVRTGNGTRRTKGLLAYGSTGLLAAVTLLMVLSPAGASAVHAKVTLSAPYKGSLGSGNQYTSVQGCASGKVTSPPKWSGTSGTISMSEMAKSATCAKVVGSVGSYSSAYADSGMAVVIPFKVSSNGAHSVSTTLNVNLASAFSSAWANCPTSKVSYPPPTNSYGYSYCEVGTDYSVYTSISVQDLNNNSWYGNYSYMDSYNDSYWENYTYCYNYGTPSCSNHTGSGGYAYTFSWNEQGAFAVNGASTLTFWTNGTNMVRTHHYVVYISISTNIGDYADQYNLAGHWLASASASMNLATLGNGAKVGSVVVT